MTDHSGTPNTVTPTQYSLPLLIGALGAIATGIITTLLIRWGTTNAPLTSLVSMCILGGFLIAIHSQLSRQHTNYGLVVFLTGMLYAYPGALLVSPLLIFT